MVGNPDKYKFRKIEKIYSPSRIDNFKLYQKTKKPLLEINVIWQKLKTFLRKYDSILRRKVALRPRRFTRSGYTVKDRSCPPRVESRLPRVEVGTSIGLNPGVSIFKNMFRMFLKKEHIKKALALATIIAVIVTAYWQNTPQTQAATYTLFQTDWSGGVSPTETHSGASQTEIDTYSAKDANTAVNGSVTLSPAAGTPITQTTDADFNLGTTSQTTVASNSVALTSNPQTYNFTGSTNDGYIWGGAADYSTTRSTSIEVHPVK